MVFYCEQAAGFCSDVGYQDDCYPRGPVIALIMPWAQRAGRLQNIAAPGT